MIAIIDYGVGNLFSLTASLKYIGAETIVTSKKEDIIKADKIILPGVGAFADAVEKLKQTGVVETIIEETKKGKPLLGICLGMQLLFEKSYEYGEHEGLGLMKGEIAPIKCDYKVPHIGWNALEIKEDPVFKYIANGDFVYYVHSFYGVNCKESTIATSKYGVEITGAVKKDNIYGMQFHPEKSGNVGLNILRAFEEL